LKTSESRYKKQGDKYKKLKAANLLMAEEFDKLNQRVAKLEASSGSSSSVNSNAHTNRDSALTVMMLAKMEDIHTVMNAVKSEAAVQQGMLTTDAVEKWTTFLNSCIHEFREWKDEMDDPMNHLATIHARSALLEAQEANLVAKICMLKLGTHKLVHGGGSPNLQLPVELFVQHFADQVDLIQTKLLRVQPNFPQWMLNEF
jgi:hypothetical protein